MQNRELFVQGAQILGRKFVQIDEQILLDKMRCVWYNGRTARSVPQRAAELYKNHIDKKIGLRLLPAITVYDIKSLDSSFED